MKITILMLCIISLTTCKKLEEENPPVVGNIVATIAFGSCNKQDSEQILWDDVINDKPDAWIWLGDNIYGDSPDTIVMKKKYDQQKSNPQYQELMTAAPIYGIWDDHDYGKNDGGKEYEVKAEMRDLMLDFLDVPDSNAVWQHEGGYQSYVLTLSDLKVKVILLDSRYFRDQPIRNGNSYDLNLKGTILGDQQWLWLENELSQANHDLVLIGNGIQIIPEEHRYEKWANFPNERKRLLEMVEGSPAEKIILLSGDRHLTEVSKIDNGKPIYEITASGMTHNYTNFKGEANKHRISEVVTEKNYGLIRVIDRDGQKTLIFESKGDHGKVLQKIKLAY